MIDGCKHKTKNNYVTIAIGIANLAISNLRWMYWTDWGTVAKIEKASMDGRNRSVIHNTSLVWPNGLTLDYSTQVLYWADASLDKIESSNVDGSNRRVLVNIAGYHPFGITLFEDTLYFSDWAAVFPFQNSIRTTNKSGGQSVQTLYQTDCGLRPYGVQVFSEQRQPQGSCIVLAPLFFSPIFTSINASPIQIPHPILSYVPANVNAIH